MRSMKSKQHEYRNSLRLGVLAKWVLALAATGVAASGYVYVRNLHIKESDYIRMAEQEMADLRNEIEMYELRIAAMLDRPALEKQLDSRSSELRAIESSSLEVVRLEHRQGKSAQIASNH